MDKNGQRCGGSARFTVGYAWASAGGSGFLSVRCLVPSTGGVIVELSLFAVCSNPTQAYSEAVAAAKARLGWHSYKTVVSIQVRCGLRLVSAVSLQSVYMLMLLLCQDIAALAAAAPCRRRKLTCRAGGGGGVSSISRLFFFIWRKSLIFFFQA